MFTEASANMHTQSKSGYDMSKEWSFILNDEAKVEVYSQFNAIIANDDGSFDCYGQDT